MHEPEQFASETDLLQPTNLVEKVHTVLLSGGSAFGLDAATSVMYYLEERRIGYDVGVTHMPIVPAAIIVDLGVGDGRLRPDVQGGYLNARRRLSLVHSKQSRFRATTVVGTRSWWTSELKNAGRLSPKRAQ